MREEQKIALRRIANAREEKSDTIDLSNLSPDGFPEEMAELNHVSTLNYSYNYT